MTPGDVASRFTRSDGSYVFARWGRPLAPVVFGVEDATLATVKGALEAVVTLADHAMAETDPELGANLLIFFVRAWQDLLDTPGVGKLVPDLIPPSTRCARGGPTSTASSASTRRVRSGPSSCS